MPAPRFAALSQTDSWATEASPQASRMWLSELSLTATRKAQGLCPVSLEGSEAAESVPNQRCETEETGGTAPASSRGRRSAARGAKIHTRVCRAIPQSRALPAPGAWACLEGCDSTRHLHRRHPHSRGGDLRKTGRKVCLAAGSAGQGAGKKDWRLLFLSPLQVAGFHGRVEFHPGLPQPAPTTGEAKETSKARNLPRVIPSQHEAASLRVERSRCLGFVEPFQKLPF